MNAPTFVSGTVVSNLTEADVALSSSGSFTFADSGRDSGATTDAQGLLILPPAGAIGTFTATILDSASGATGDTTGTIQWNYTVDPALVQYLGLGEQLVLTYELQIVDLDGNTLIRPITITITGTNDAPVITAIDVSETLPEGTGADLLSTTGSVSFADADTGNTADVVTMSEALHSVVWTGGTLSGEALTALETALNTAFSLGGTTSGNAGTTTWALSLASSAVDFLADGETLTVTYRITATDDSGDSTGTTDTQDVTITITGTNDAPTLADVTLTATDTAGDDPFADQTGTLAHTDADTTDEMTFGIGGATEPSTESGFDVQQVGTYGTLHVNATTGAYKFVANGAAIEALKASTTETFTVTVFDGIATTNATVTLDITATNDDADITGTISGSVTEASGDANAVPGTPTATGNVDHTDRDAADANDAWVSGTLSGTYGSLTIDESGDWTYTLNNDNTAVQALNATSMPLTDTIIVSTTGGTTQAITITINGANDFSVSAGDLGTIGEAGGVLNGTNATPTVSGDIDHTDVDNTPDVWQSGTITGTYGTLTIGTDGAWTYALDNGNDTVQALDDVADFLTDTITVLSEDGTAHDIVITITGADDAAVITGDISGTIIEAGGNANGTDPDAGQITGNLDHTDVDGDDDNDVWTSVAPVAGSYGTFSMNAAGEWTYQLDNDNAAVQGLKTTGQTLTETFTVETSGGTQQTVTITITGSNDDAVITGTTTGSVTEAGGVLNGTTGTMIATDDLGHTDVDTDDANDTWVAQTVNDDYGTFTFTSGGVWTYTLDDSLAATQALDLGDTETRTFTVATTGGTTTDVVVTITGRNDAPTGVASVSGIADYVDAPNSTTAVLFRPTGGGSQGVRSGTITVSDVDADAQLKLFDTDGISPNDQADVHHIRANATFEWLNSRGTVLGSSTGLTSGAPTTGTLTTSLSIADRADILNAFDIQSVTQVTNAEGNPELQIVWSFDDLHLSGVAGITVDSNGALPLPPSVGTVSVNFLAAGETLRVTFPVTVADQHGATHRVNVPIIFTGANDAPTGTEDWSFQITEGQAVTTGDGSVSGTPNDLTGTLVDDTHNVVVVDNAVTGTVGEINSTFAIAWSDPDLRDTGHTVAASVVSATAGNGATLPAGADYSSYMTPSLAFAAAGNSGQINWTFTAPDSAFDFLADGQTLTIVYRFDVTDRGELATTSDDRTITVTITGTNDGPVVTAGTTNAVTEDGTATGTAVVSGTLAGEAGANWVDIDASDDPLLEVTKGSFGADLQDTLSFVVMAPGGDTANYAEINGTYGTLYLRANGEYIYVLDNSRPATQALDDTVNPTETFHYTIADRQDAEATSTLIITVTGANDAPVLGSVVNPADVAEDVNASAQDISLGGSFAVSDVDANDTLSIQIGTPVLTNTGTALDVPAGLAAAVASALSASATVNSNSNEAGLTIAWTFTANDLNLDFLNLGDTLTIAFPITLSDGTATSAPQTLTITITGTNDGPVAVADTATVAEAGATASGTASVTGNVVTNDTDADQNHELTVVEASSSNLSGTAAAVGTETTITGQFGTLTISADGSWTYALADSDADTQALDDGADGTETFSVTISDENGAQSTANLTITITGANDAPVLAAITAPADIDEIADAAAQALSASGTLSVTDVDAVDTLTATPGTPTVTLGGEPFPLPAGAESLIAAGALTFTGTPSSAGGTAQTIDWAYSVGTADLDFLREGQELVLTFPVTVGDGADASNTQNIVITIIGTNDGPVAVDDDSSNASGTIVKEAGDEPTVTGLAIASGDVLANDTDADAGDTKAVTQIQAGEGTAAAVTSGTTSADGTVVTGTYGTLTIGADGTWSYLLDDTDNDTQALAAGERVADVFTYTMVDGQGISASTTLTVHIEGSNDGPVIDGGPATASMNEGAAGTTPPTLSGTFSFTDPDASDRPGSGISDTVGVASLTSALVVTGATLNPEQLAAAQLLSSAFSATLASGATNAGTINWNFAPSEAAVNFLREAQTATLTFTVTLDDGNGGSDSETVTITLTGTNDAVTLLPGGTLSGTVTEQTEAEEAAPEAPETLTATGTFQFTDPDLAANPVQRLNHLGVVNGPSQWGGTLTQETLITEPATGTKTVTWTYSVAANNPNLQALGAGETLTETFSLRVLDQSGSGFLLQPITITLTGTNDRPVITVVDVAETLAEDAGASLATSGSLSFTDADISVGGSAADTSTVTETLHAVAWTNAGGALTLDTAAQTALETALNGAFSIAGAGVATAANNGTVTWAFDLPQTAVNFLAAGETLTVTYRVTVTDDSGDTATNTATQDVTITITGANDVPTLAAETLAVVDTAAADSFADITGTLDGADLDATDVLTYGLATGEDGVGTFGTLTVTTSGTYSYVVDAAAVDALSADATETFTVQVTDSAGVTTTQTLTVNVTGANDTPEAQHGTATATEDAGAITIDVADLISDRDSADTDATLTVTPTVDPAQGSVSVSGTVITFTPMANFFGTATISYTVQDAGGLESDPATITVNVAPVADTDTVVQNGTLDVDSQSATSPGELTIGTGNTASGFVIATDAADAAGVELGLSTVMRFQGPATRDANGAFVVQAGVSSGTVNDGASAGDDGWARWNIVFSINADTDDNGGTLADLDYRVTISEQTETGLVSRLSFTLQEYAAALDTLIGTGAGAAFLAQSLRQDMINLEWDYIATAWNTTGAEFDPSNPGFYQVDLVASTFAGTGGAPASELLRATMQVRVNSPVTAMDDTNAEDAVIEAGVLTVSGTTTPVGDNTASGNVLTNDEDPDLYPVADETELTVVSVAFGATTGTVGTALDGTYGALTLNTDGTWTYTLGDTRTETRSLKQGETATEVFTYTVTDPDGETDTATLTITITGSNDAPFIDAGSGAGADTGAVEEDVTTSVTGTLGGGLDPDADAELTWSVTNDSPYGTMTIDPATSVWTFTLGAGAQALTDGQSVEHTFTATVTDEFGATATKDITVTITGTNDIPVVTTATGQNAGTVEEPGERTDGAVSGTLTVTGTLTATDADLGETATLAWTTTGTATYGTFTLDTDGSWTYTLDPALVDTLAESDTRTETFAIIVTDAMGATAGETVTITVDFHSELSRFFHREVSHL